MAVPGVRVRALHDAPVAPGGAYVLYWMVAQRRARSSYALDRAREWCEELGRPLLVFEPLRVGYRWASDRLHRFVLDGMAEHSRAFADAGVTYLPYVERSPGEGSGLLARLAERAAIVVTDDYPTFFLPRMLAAAASRLSVRLEAVDGAGLIPMRRPDKTPVTARGYRRWAQGVLPEELARAPRVRPLEAEVLRGAAIPDLGGRWAPVSAEELADPAPLIAGLPIDHDVPATDERGGGEAGRARWRRFVEDGLGRYAKDGNHPDRDATSGVSPWLHFGHLSAHELFADVAGAEGWSVGDQAPKPNGKREGWWNMSEAAEAFLEQLTCWRELSFAVAAARPDHAERSILPDWANRTLDAHADDPRDPVYSLDDLEAAQTYDEIWNAAQRQLREEGRIHNYLRMLWGKKILEWSPSPDEALSRMIALNDRWALDGRDPNSYSGITWILGHLDRAWGPERPIYGKVRYMTSASTRRKLSIDAYLARWG